MSELAIFIWNILCVWLAIAVFLSLAFLSYLRSSQNNILADDLLKTAVILCLRKAEPFSSDWVRILLNQNYPQYDLKLVIDSLEDPGWKIATDTIQEQQATNVPISPLTIIRKNCSLKCSSIVQAVLELDNSYQVVALIDADTVVYSNWRRELVTPTLRSQSRSNNRDNLVSTHKCLLGVISAVYMECM